MNKKNKSLLIFTTIFLLPHIVAMNNKKRGYLSHKISDAKRRKTSYQEDMDKELNIRKFIKTKIQENNINELIFCSNNLIKNQLKYNLIHLDVLLCRYYTHHYLYNFFCEKKYTTYAEENRNLKRKTYTEWQKRKSQLL